MSENTSMNIYQKLAKIRKLVEVMQKNKAGFNYKYVTEDILLAKITSGLERYGLSLYPSIPHGTLSVLPYPTKAVKLDKAGSPYETITNEVLVYAEMVWTWINNDDPTERVDVPWVLAGQQGDASRAFGSALTYSSRYFLLKFFNVSTTEDDPDNWRSKQHEAAAEAELKVTKPIIDEIDEIVQSRLPKMDTAKRDELKVLLKTKISKGGKPSAFTKDIIGAEQAAEVLDLVRKFFNIKEAK